VQPSVPMARTTRMKLANPLAKASESPGSSTLAVTPVRQVCIDPDTG
jgi:hypothetical protein